MMSAPVHRDDETDDFRFYAPPRVRERATSQAVDAAALNSPAIDSRDTAAPPTSSAPDLPEGVVSGPADPPPGEAKADSDKQPHALLHSQVVLQPRIAPGLGGPNLQQPTSSASASPARVKPPLKFALAEGSEDEWPRALGRRAFEGDVAIKQLRDRMSLDPSFVPAPPVRVRKRPVMPWLIGLTVVAGIAAMGAFGIAWMTEPTAWQAALKEDRSITPVVARKPVGPQLASISTAIRPSARLVVEDRQVFTNEALRLGISLDGGSGEEVALLSGLVTGTRLSIGTPFGTNGWRLPARDLTQALAYAPNDFAGVMEGTVDVRTENDVLIDSRRIQLAWLPKQPDGTGREALLKRKDPVQPATIPSAAIPSAATPLVPTPSTPALDPEEIATLMRRGEELLKTGDIAAARLVLRRAANAGHAQAALTMGATFDPVILAELGVLGFPPDPAQARSWYDKAARLGLDEAQRRIERLARAGN
jgi:hypothetical protein